MTGEKKMEVVSFDKPDEFAAGLELLKRQIPQIIELGRLRAQIRKGYYDSCIAQGFTPEQALTLTASYDFVAN